MRSAALAPARSSVLRSRNGSALIETALISGTLFLAVTFGVECIHLIMVQRSVSETAAVAARITKEICPVPNANRFEHIMSAAYYVEREQMSLAHLRIRKIAESLLPNIQMSVLSDYHGSSSWYGSDVYGIPDRSRTPTHLDDDKRFGEIIISSWIDKELRGPEEDTASSESEPYRVIVSSAAATSHGFHYPYNQNNVIPSQFHSLHSSPTLPSDSPMYMPMKRAVNQGIGCSLAEMWYEYRPVTGLFRQMLKSMTGHEYKVLYAVAAA